MTLSVASERPSTFEQAQPSGLLTLDFSDPERAATQAQRFAREYPLNGVLGVDDDTVVVAAAIAERLGLRGNTVMAALRARDKYEQRVGLERAGVRVPRFAVHPVSVAPAQLGPTIRYPAVLKPLRLAASRGVIRANGPEEFVAAWERIRAILSGPDIVPCGEAGQRILVEDFVPGPEVAVDGLLRRGLLQVLAIFDKPDPLEGPFFEETIYVTPSRLPREVQNHVERAVQAATRALGLAEGAVHVELRCNRAGVWLIELAARPIGGRCSSALRFELQGKREEGRGKGKATLEEILIRHAMGETLPAFRREAQGSGVMMIPVPAKGVLREVRGLEEARAVPLVSGVEITAHKGDRLVPWPEGARYPGFIFARGAEPEAVEAALRAAHARLDFILE